MGEAKRRRELQGGTFGGGKYQPRYPTASRPTLPASCTAS
jgi:hypothetical protein